jgi:hypothetical protein
VFVCLSVVLLFSSAGLFSYVLFQRRFLMSVSSVADVVGIARRTDVLELRDLLDPLKEDLLRANTTPIQFQDAQRMRARILFEQLRAMTFNALVVLLWTEQEQKKLHRTAMPRDEVRLQAAAEIGEDGPTVRLVGIASLVRLVLRIALDAMRIRTLRQLAQLRTFAGADALEAYERLAQATISLASAYGAHAVQQLRLILLGQSKQT